MTATASANLGNASDERVFRGLCALAKTADVIGVQESGDRYRMLRRFCDATGWEMWFDKEIPGSASVAILWNPQTVLGTSPSVRPCTPSTDCGGCGVGPDKVKAKVWNKVRFTPRDGGKPFVFINGHLPASLYCKCRSRLGDVMIEELTDMVTRRKVDVIATMDGNSSPWASRWNPLRRAGMKQWTRRPTHKLRLIDLIWTRGCEGKARLFKGKYSDHRWVIFDLA